MILNVNTTLLIFCVIIIGTVTKGNNGNEETRVTATRRVDIECQHHNIDILLLLL